MVRGGYLAGGQWDMTEEEEESKGLPGSWNGGLRDPGTLSSAPHVW